MFRSYCPRSRVHRQFRFLSAALLTVSATFCASAQIDVPVNPLTGHPQVSIPIFSVGTRTLSAPITLVYSGGGVRVGEGEGSAGIGWSLSAGGRVTREVRGLPDDVDEGTSGRRGWLYFNLAADVGSFTPSGDDILGVCTDELADWNKLNSYGWKLDTEPDVFYFNAPGLGGQFVFDNSSTPQVRVVPYQDLNISITRDGTTQQITRIDIINNAGVKYIFSVAEKVTRQTYGAGLTHFRSMYEHYASPLSYNGSWVLSQIISQSGEAVNFSHTTGSNRVSYDYQTIDNSIGSKIDTLYSIKSETETAQLTSVNAGLVTANIKWDGNIVTSVEIAEGVYNDKKKFTFRYNWVKENGDPAMTTYRKAFLREVTEESNCQTFPSYEFSYYGIYPGAYEGGDSYFPIRNLKAQDYWGYFNNVPGTLVPPVYVDDAAGDGERYRTQAKAGYTLITGANRSVNASTIHFASLRKIEYPSGGFSEIVYEPADYFDGDSTRRGGGIRVKSVKISDGDYDTSNDIVTTYEYKDGDNSSGKVIYKPSFAFDNGVRMVRTSGNLSPAWSVLYEKVTVKQSGRGKTIYDYLVPAVYPAITDNDFQATRLRIARSSCPSGTTLKNGYYIFPFAPNTNWDFERGLSSKITVYNEAGTVLTEQTTSYQRITTGTVTIQGLRFEELPNSVYVYGLYTILAQVDKVVRTERTKTFDQVSTSNFVIDSTRYTYKNLGTSPNVSIHLDSISSVDSDGAFSRKRFRYAKDFAVTSPSGQDATMMAALNAAHMHGTLVESISQVKRGATVTTGAELTRFALFNSTDILPSTKQVFTSTGAFTPASINGSDQFVFDSRYRPVLFVDAYDDIGNPLSTRDAKRTKQGVHYGFGQSLPVAALSNAAASEAVFTDFESASLYQLTYVTGNKSTDAWTGKYALSMAAVDTLVRSAVSKGSGRYYRFTCRVKATTGSNISVTAKAFNGAVENGSAVLTYPAAASGTWKFLEGRMDMNSVSTGFILRITTSAGILIDDIAFYPEAASISTTTYKPLYGVTSQTDSRGISSFIEYDALGRQRFIRNQDKDVVRINDYQYGKATVSRPVSSFSSGTVNNQIAMDSTVTFTADASCMTGVTYAWSATNGATGTGTTFQTSFSENRDYFVKLTASHALYGSSTTELMVNPVSFLRVSVKLAPGQSNQMLDCTDNFVRNFVALTSGCDNDVHYDWEYRLSSSGVWVDFPFFDDVDELEFDLLDYGPKQSYAIRCTVTSSCPDLSAPGSAEVIEITSQLFQVTYVNNSPCH